VSDQSPDPESRFTPRRQARGSRHELDRYRTWAAGHALSPIPSLAAVRDREKIIYEVRRELRASIFNEAGQLRLFSKLREFYPRPTFS